MISTDIGKNDMINAYITPPAGGIVHNLEFGDFPLELSRVKSSRLHAIAIIAGSAGNNLAVDNKVNARPAMV